MPVEQQPTDSLKAAISQNPEAAQALDGLVKRELDIRIAETSKAAEERNRYSRVEGVMASVLLTAGLAMGVAALLTLTPMVALTGIAGGVAGTFGLLLGIAAVGAKSDAQRLEADLKELKTARQVAEDPQVVASIADEKLREKQPETGKSQWTQRIVAAEKDDCHSHTLH